MMGDFVDRRWRDHEDRADNRGRPEIYMRIERIEENEERWYVRRIEQSKDNDDPSLECIWDLISYLTAFQEIVD